MEGLQRQRLGVGQNDGCGRQGQWGHDFRPEYRRLAELRAQSAASTQAAAATA